MPTVETPLAGVRVLVTRPPSQAARLTALISDFGGTPIRFPTLMIVPVTPSGSEIEALALSNLVVFVSANAVTHGYEFLRAHPVAARRIVPIGRATMEALKTAGCRNVHDPGNQSSSEDLLAQPLLQEVSGHRVCIVRGRGGRELLRETLEARGAEVSYLECYRRARPERPDTRGLERVLAGDPASLVITSTSATGLGNLLDMTPPPLRARLLARPLVVIGKRQREEALGLGWLGPVITAAAGNKDLVEGIIAWRREQQETTD